MKNQTHTPGKWHVGPENCGSGRNIYSGRDYIGHTVGYNPRSGSKERTLSKEEAEANAALIASAPMLLEALIRIADRVKYHAGGEAPFSLESIGNEARLAIAAAQGEKEV